MLPKKSGGCGVVPWPIATSRGVTPGILPCLPACALLVVASYAWAQQDNTTVTKPKETIVVTGVYEPLPLGEVDRPVTQIDIRSNELVSNSLEDFLRLDSSVDLQERGVNGTQADVAMRGGTFEQTLILVDGFRMNDLQTGHHDMDLPFPVDSFSDVEVLHGAGSTLYGSDAVGGAINFITHPPPATELRVRTGLGNFGVNQESGTGSLVDGSLAEQLIFARDYSSGFMPDRDYRDLALTSLTDFSMGLGNTELILAHNDRPFGANQFYGPYDSWEHTNTYFVAAKQDLGKSTQISFAYRHHRDRFVLFREDPLYYQNLHALESFQAALRRRQGISNNTHLFYGAEGYSDSIHSTNLGDHTRGRVAAYAALDTRALKRFSFNIGAREEVYRSVQGQFSPSISAGYWMNSHLKFRGNVSHAFRVPSMTDLYYHDPTSVGNPNLRPERAWDYETGLDWNGPRRLHGDLTVFDLSEKGVIDYERSSPTAVWQATNIDQIDFRGVESSLQAPLLHSQEIDLSYTAMHGYHQAMPGIESEYAFWYPAQSGIFSWRAQLPHGILARSRVGVLDRYGYKSYGLWDVYLARSAGRIHPFIQLTNLTNTSYQEVQMVAMPGREVVAGVEVAVFSGRK
ncbi:MAG TPA: TonB-dependent receptor [Terriglobia bacterium]|nr:TonB-dependent receptor [Terriglobia bacterium]